MVLLPSRLRGLGSTLIERHISISFVRKLLATIPCFAIASSDGFTLAGEREHIFWFQTALPRGGGQMVNLARAVAVDRPLEKEPFEVTGKEKTCRGGENISISEILAYRTNALRSSLKHKLRSLPSFLSL